VPAKSRVLTPRTPYIERLLYFGWITYLWWSYLDSCGLLASLLNGSSKQRVRCKLCGFYCRFRECEGCTTGRSAKSLGDWASNWCHGGKVLATWMTATFFFSKLDRLFGRWIDGINHCKIHKYCTFLSFKDALEWPMFLLKNRKRKRKNKRMKIVYTIFVVTFRISCLFLSSRLLLWSRSWPSASLCGLRSSAHNAAERSQLCG
jgi:hypothetical protein